MRNLKNQKGVTLVALVVTIIVLLILAGISLSLVAGSNGIMTRAVNASNTNESATAAEQAELKIAEIQIDYYEAYYVTEDATVMGQSMVQYIESKIGSGIACSNTRYFMVCDKDASGKTGTIKVYVGNSSAGTLVATRKYETGSEDTGNFTWADAKWSYMKTLNGGNTTNTGV